MDVDGARKMPEGYFDKIGGIGHSKTIPYGSSQGQIGMLESKQTQEPEFDMESLCSCSEIYWFNCYESDSRYKQFITPESFAHPAKASFGLIERIYKHLELLGLLKPEDCVIDFMSGTGRINILAALRGHKTISIELELHFAEMMTGFDCDGLSLISQPIHSYQRWLSLRCGKDGPHNLHRVIGNKEVSEQKAQKDLDWQVIQGDARKLSELLKEGGVGVVSPPYQNTIKGDHYDSAQQRVLEGRYNGQRPDVFLSKTNIAAQGAFNGYSKNSNNIGNLSDKPSNIVGIASPPYEQVMERNKPDHPNILNADPEMKKLREGQLSYGESPAQIGNLKDDNLVGITSPAYENINITDYTVFNGGVSESREVDINPGNAIHRRPYNKENEDNLGNTQGESYTQAMLQVYSEAFKAGISPLIIITKNPTREHKLRRLDISTAEMLQKAGYRIIDYHRAVLFKIARNETLDGSKEAETYKGRLSFFKRLSLEKGNVAAEWEDVLIAVNPSGNFGKVGAASPPYHETGNKIPSGSITKWKNETGEWRTGMKYSDNPDNIGNLKNTTLSRSWGVRNGCPETVGRGLE